MTPTNSDPYGLDPLFERAIVTLACSNARFFGRVGREIDPELLNKETSKIALRAARAIDNDIGHGPDTTMVVVQRLRRWMQEGKVSYEAIQKVVRMFERAEDAGLPSTESAIAEITPVLQSRLRDAAVTEAISSFGKGGDLSRVTALEERASRVGQVDTSVGTVLGADSWAEIASLRDLERLKLGVPELDAILDGGLTRGCLGVLIGGSGDGKSITLSHIGAANLMDGLHVGYATLELPRPQVLARFKAHLTNIPINALLGGDTKLAKKRLRRMGPQLGRLVVQDFPPMATTIEDIKAWVERCEELAQRKMDLLLVDYGDKVGVRSKKKDDESGYSQGRIVFEGLRYYAHERKMFCWTASQGTRQKDKRKRLDLNDAADSMHKIRVADMVITLNVREEDDLITLLFYIAKNRYGVAKKEVGPFPTAYEVGQIVPCV